MHRSNFRAKRESSRLKEDAPQTRQAPSTSLDISSIREEISSLGAKIAPIAMTVETLAAPKRDVSVPGDIAKSLDLIHARLDRLERVQKEQNTNQKRAETAFSNAILKMADKVEKISGGEDSEFSLAHSLEKLIQVLSARKYHVTRDRDGNMVEFEVGP